MGTCNGWHFHPQGGWTWKRIERDWARPRARCTSIVAQPGVPQCDLSSTTLGRPDREANWRRNEEGMYRYMCTCILYVSRMSVLLWTGMNGHSIDSTLVFMHRHASRTHGGAQLQRWEGWIAKDKYNFNLKTFVCMQPPRGLHSPIRAVEGDLQMYIHS